MYPLTDRAGRVRIQNPSLLSCRRRRFLLDLTLHEKPSLILQMSFFSQFNPFTIQWQCLWFPALMFFSLALKKKSNRFIAKLSRKCSVPSRPPSSSQASPTIASLPQGYVCYKPWTYMTHYHSKSIGYIRAHSEWPTFCEFGQMYNDMYSPWRYTE